MANHEMNITSDMVAAFHGSDNMNIEYLLAEIVDLLNYNYTLENARHDVIDNHFMWEGNEDDS